MRSGDDPPLAGSDPADGVVVFSALLIVKAHVIKPPAHVFPVTIAAATGALAARALVLALTRPKLDRLFAPGQGRVVLAGAVGLLAYAMAMALNYLAATFVFLVAAYLFLVGERTPRSVAVAALVAAMVTGFTWLCFAVWLGVNLPG